MSKFPRIAPIAGTWYSSNDLPESFVVVDCDDDYIEIQYHGGKLDRLDPEEWNASYSLHEIAEPEDAAPFDTERDENIVEMLKDVESQQDLDEHLHDFDDDNST